MLTEDIDYAIKTLLFEAPKKPANPEIAKQAKKLGLVWKRVGYGKEGEKGITHKVKDGKLEPVDDKEPEDDKEKGGEEKEEPKATVVGKDAVADRGKNHNTDVDRDYTDRGMDEPEVEKPKDKKQKFRIPQPKVVKSFWQKIMSFIMNTLLGFITVRLLPFMDKMAPVVKMPHFHSYSNDYMQHQKQIQHPSSFSKQFRISAHLF